MTTESPPPTTAEDDLARRKESFEYTKSVLLGKRVKCTLSDGRTLSGRFICIDRLKNMILTNVTEERWIDPSEYRYHDKNDDDDDNTARPPYKRVERHISQAMIPGSRLAKVEIAKSLLPE